MGIGIKAPPWSTPAAIAAHDKELSRYTQVDRNRPSEYSRLAAAVTLLIGGGCIAGGIVYTLLA